MSSAQHRVRTPATWARETTGCLYRSFLFPSDRLIHDVPKASIHSVFWKYYAPNRGRAGQQAACLKYKHVRSRDLADGLFMLRVPGIVALRKSLEEQQARAREATTPAQGSHDGHTEPVSEGGRPPDERRATRGSGHVSTDPPAPRLPRLTGSAAIATVAPLNIAAGDYSASREDVSDMAVGGGDRSHDGDGGNTLGPSTASPLLMTASRNVPLTSPTAVGVGSEAIKEACHVLVALQTGARREQPPAPQSGGVRQSASVVGQQDTRWVTLVPHDHGVSYRQVLVSSGQVGVYRLACGH